MLDRRILFMTVGVVITALILSVVIFQINKVKITNLHSEIAMEKEKDSLIADILVLKNQIASYRNLFPQTDDVAWFLDEIHNMVEATDIDLDFIEPQEKLNRELYVKIPVAMGCSASFEQLARFISLVEGFPKYLYIDEFKVTQLPVSQGKDDEILFGDRYDAPQSTGFYLDEPRAFIKVATIVPSEN